MKRLVPILLLLLLTIPVFGSLIRSGYFPMHDDMQAMRLLQIDKCFKDGQIPCRWVPDMGYGYGYPQFNFYSPAPYYIMEGFHLVGFGYLDSVKIGFILSVLFGAAGMYLLGSSLWGRSGGMISALFYSFANYRAVNMYVRGAMGELSALTFMPFILWSVFKLYKGNKRFMFWTAFFMAGLITSHNISTLIFIPVIILWSLFLPFYLSTSPVALFKKNVLVLSGSALWSLMLSAYFILPAWMEKEYVHIESMLQGYFNYLAHFVSIKQLLFSSYFNYGTSGLGAYDEMSLTVGFLSWFLPICTLMMFLIIRKKKETQTLALFLFIGFLALFMTHSKSTFIWQRINVLSYLQFPWRFLAIATLSFSVACGSFSLLLNEKRQRAFAVILIFFLLVFLNSSYFQPKLWLNIDDEDKFSGDLWEKQLTISIFDYLPIYAKAPPAEKAFNEPRFIQGEGKVLTGEKGSDWQNWQISVDTKGKLQLPLFYYPGWVVNVNSGQRLINYDNDLGLITFDVDQNDRTVNAKLYDTPLRKFSNILTLLGVLAIPIYFFKLRKNV